MRRSCATPGPLEVKVEVESRESGEARIYDQFKPHRLRPARKRKYDGIQLCFRQGTASSRHPSDSVSPSHLMAPLRIPAATTCCGSKLAECAHFLTLSTTQSLQALARSL